MPLINQLYKGACRAQQLLGCNSLHKILQIPTRFESSFVPRHVLILTKISRYQIEKLSNPDLTEDQLKHKLLATGMNYDAILAGHQRNKATESKVIKTLKRLNILYRTKDRHSIDNDSISWADLIVPVGGDGTFLLASNLINNNKKPIIGINSDPEFSEGFLMLPPKYTNDIEEIFEKLKCGHFKYLMRSRIRTTLSGENIWKMPFHMHEKNESDDSEKFYISHHNATKPRNELPKVRQLPWLALNEVFIGESLSARISILHVNVDGNNTFHKTKSSGICISTGTGSSSWYRAINSLSPEMVKDIVNKTEPNKIHSNEQIERLSFEYNSKLQYPADELRSSYAIRDMIVKHVWPLPQSIKARDFCEKLTIRSQCCDGGLVIDGGIGVHFNVGTTAVFETLPEDTLKNIVLFD